MGHFECNSVEDLLFNNSFRKWVIDPHSGEAAWWGHWVTQHPDKHDMVNHAKAILYALQINFYSLSKEQVDEEITTALQRVNDHANDLDDDIPQARFSIAGFRPLPLFAIAATVLLIIVAGWFMIRTSSSVNDPYQYFVKENKSAVTEQVNNSGAKKLIQLPDGSHVYLEDKSTLTWHAGFAGKREVYLSGDAFFEVTKDASRPFVVYTQHVITRVLGTSFRVKAWQQDTAAVVAVKTGKVSVYKREQFIASGNLSKEVSGIMVTPNQQVVYNDVQHELRKAIVEKPLPVTEPGSRAFTFEATPIPRVFKQLQDAYGIAIVYDEDILAGCSLSAVMGEEPFYDKLNLICKAINASYEIIDGNIIITAKGCR